MNGKITKALILIPVAIALFLLIWSACNDSSPPSNPPHALTDETLKSSAATPVQQKEEVPTVQHIADKIQKKTAAYRQVGLGLRLLATVVADADTSLALIEDKRTQAYDSYHIGDTVKDNIIVKDIFKGSVALEVDDQEVILKISLSTQDDSKTTEQEELALYTPEESVPNDLDIPDELDSSDEEDVPSPLSLVLNSEQLQTALSDPQDFLFQIDVNPHYVNDSITGLEVLSIQEDSLLSQMGIASGDEIQAICGHKLKSEDDLALIQRLMMSAEDQIRLEMKRGNREFIFDFQIDRPEI